MTMIDTEFELDAGWTAMDQGKFEKAAGIARQHIVAPDKFIRAEANRLAGHAYLQLRRPEDALPHFQEAASIEKNAESIFSVATTAALAGDIELGENTMMQIATMLEQEETAPGRISMPQAALYYAFALCETGRFDIALDKLNWLRDLYAAHKNTDEDFLYEHGMPVLPHCLQLVVAVLNGLGPSFDGDAWINDFADMLDDAGRDEVMTLLQA